MSETAWSRERRTSQAYHWSGRRRPSREQFARMDPVERASEEALQRESAERGRGDADQYEALKREDEFGNSGELLPGDRGYWEGPIGPDGNWS